MPGLYSTKQQKRLRKLIMLLITPEQNICNEIPVKLFISHKPYVLFIITSGSHL